MANERNMRRSAPPALDSKVPLPTEVVFTSARNQETSGGSAETGLLEGLFHQLERQGKPANSFEKRDRYWHRQVGVK